MAHTYDATLPTDKDRVRFLINDRLVDGTAVLEDEEIQHWVTAEGNAFLAAAICMPLVYGALKARNDLDVIEKWVGPLKVKFGERGGANAGDSAVQKQIEWLRQRGAEETIQTPRIFRVMS